VVTATTATTARATIGKRPLIRLTKKFDSIGRVWTEGRFVRLREACGRSRPGTATRRHGAHGEGSPPAISQPYLTQLYVYVY
jgi:hypothetical protein